MKEVKIGCYGFGPQGHQIFGYIPPLSRARLTAIGQIAAERFANIRKSDGLPEVPAFDDFDTFLAEADCNLISLCTEPRADQYHLLARALRAGKNVLAEKPMAMTVDELDELRRICEETGSKLYTMTGMPYDPYYTAMHNIVRSGKLGTIVQIYALKSYPYRDSRPQDRREDGGIIRQAGIHAISIIRHVTGLEFTEVFAQDTGVGNPGSGELQMGANVTYRMNNGALTALLCNYCNPPGLGFHGNDQIRIHGTEGMIESVDGGTRHVMALSGKDAEEFQGEEPPVSFIQDIVNDILDGTAAVLTQEDAFRNTEAVIRAQDSADTGKPVKF